MKAAIVAVRSRSQHVDQLAAVLQGGVDSLDVFWDDKRQGAWWNYSRTIEVMTGKAKPGEPVLICTDDAVTVPDWRDRWEALHSTAQAQRYCLFHGSKDLITPENLERGYAEGILYRAWCDQAMVLIDQPTLMQDFKRWLWFDNGLHSKWLHHRKIVAAKGRLQYIDIATEGYLIAKKLSWVAACPTIFDHAPLASITGHRVGEYKSPSYVGKPGTFQPL